MVLPAPLAPESRTISPVDASRSTPASAGKRPRRQTAERQRTTAGTLASGLRIEARVYGRWLESGRTGDARPQSVGVSLHAHAQGARSRGTGAGDRRACCSSSSSPTSSGAPACTRPRPRTTSRSSSSRPSSERVRRPRPTSPTATTTPATDDPVVPTTAPSAPFAAPPEGDAVGRIGIPKIGVDKFVVEGVNVDDLRKGPGPLPEHPDARARGQQRDRRPPHHLRRAVRRPRPARPRRRDPGGHGAGRLPLQGHRATRGRPERDRACSTRHPIPARPATSSPPSPSPRATRSTRPSSA